MEPLISVVVPVYKVENYLERCVESLLAQTYENIEIILVDDGSPDALISVWVAVVVVWLPPVTPVPLPPVSNSFIPFSLSI